MDRVILHCDMNSFFASVELLYHPELRNVPMAVAGDPEHRHGIILAKNDFAKAFGIVTAETVQSALKKCPELQLVAPHHEKYKYFSGKLNEIYLRYTDQVEPFSIDESWLDVTASQALFGNGKYIADEIRDTVKKEYNLTLSVGVSYNKIFAKMGSEYRKPDATTVISKDNYRQLLWPQDISNFFYAGKVTSKKLYNIGIYTVGDLAKSKPSVLESLLGKQGLLLYKYVNGGDNAPVHLFDQKNQIKSVGNGRTFRRNLTTEHDINTAAAIISDLVSRRLREYGLKCTGVKVEIKDPDFKKVSKQRKLKHPLNTAIGIKSVAVSLIKELGFYDKPIRMLTITSINLIDENAYEQLSIFSEDAKSSEKDEKVERTMDDIRNKFGSDSIKFALSIGNDLGLHISEKEPKKKDE